MMSFFEEHKGDPRETVDADKRKIVTGSVSGNLGRAMNWGAVTDLALADLANLASVSLFFADNADIKKQLLKQRAQQLLNHVILGHYAEVKKILTETTNLPALRRLLTFVGTVTASSGQVMKGTALRLALAAEDIDYIDGNGKKTIDGMDQLIKAHLQKLKETNTQASGNALIASQTATQFPDGWEEQEQKNHEANINALKAVRTAIAASTTNAECEDALRIFRNQVTPQGVIETGKQWDARLLQAAFELGFNEYDNFDDRQNKLYYVKVVGYIQRSAPDNYAQAQAQGMRRIVQKRENLNRCLDFKESRGSYFPLAPNDTGLGYTYLANGAAVIGYLFRGNANPANFTTFITNKYNNMARIIARETEQHQKPRCAVM